MGGRPKVEGLFGPPARYATEWHLRHAAEGLTGALLSFVHCSVAQSAYSEHVKLASELTRERKGSAPYLPVNDHVRQLLPGGGLRRGSVVGVASGAPGSMSLMLTMPIEASKAGSSVAIAGLPTVGFVAADELGLVLARTAVVPDLGHDPRTSSAHWSTASRWWSSPAPAVSGRLCGSNSPPGRGSVHRSSFRLTLRAPFAGARRSFRSAFYERLAPLAEARALPTLRLPGDVQRSGQVAVPQLPPTAFRAWPISG